MKQHLLFIHAFTGCDTVSSIFGLGKKSALALLEEDITSEWDCLDVFKSDDASHEDIASVGEKFLLKLYGGSSSESLDTHRYLQYIRSMQRNSLASPTFKLECIPPTSGACKFHSYRAYLTVQQWLGNYHLPTQWGWQYQNGKLVPVFTDREVAPKQVLKMISCGCKKGCTNRCKCQKSGLKCSNMCKHCAGKCQNGPDIDLLE